MPVNERTGEVTRDFTMEVDDMLQRGQLFHSMAQDDQPAFQQNFPWFTIEFLEAFQVQIDTAHKVPLDLQVLAEQTLLTRDVQQALAAGCVAVEEMYAYVEVTYMQDAARRKAFGQSDFQNARQSASKLPEVLELIYDLASENPYKDALLAKGCTQASIDALPVLAATIRQKNRAQKLFMKQRPVLTQDRLEIYNAVWATMKAIHTCSQKTFRTDAEKLDQYQLYPSAAAQVTSFVVQLVHKLNSTPFAGGRVTLTNFKPQESQTSNARGETRWQDKALPKAVNVLVQVSGQPDRLINGHGLTGGQSNFLRVEV